MRAMQIAILEGVAKKTSYSHFDSHFRRVFVFLRVLVSLAILWRVVHAVDVDAVQEIELQTP